MRTTIRAADESAVRVLDGLVVFWVVLWLVVGAWSAVTIWQLSDVGGTITSSGRALTSTGEALQALGDIPFVGGTPADLGDEVVATAQDVTARGQQVHSQLRQLSVALGLSIMVIPTTPVLGLYLPLRMARRRDLRDVRRALGDGEPDPALERYLAERALANLSYAEVRRISDDPWRDVTAGRGGALADAELARMRLRRPSDT